jgi:hypothetical protein
MVRRRITGLWKRRAVTREDPVFGRIVRGRDDWTVAASARPLISCAADDGGPTDAQRCAHQRLETQLRDFAGDLSNALYELYAPYLALPDWDGPRPDSASALRELLELSSVRYLRDGTPELLFAIKGDVWPDAMLIVEIRGGKVRGVSLDD